MPVRLKVRAEGLDRVRGILRGQQRRGRSFVRGASPAVIRHLQTTVLQYFQSQNGPGGWPRLHPATIERKGHSTILLEKGRLIPSLTGHTRDSIVEVSRLRLRWGTRTPYAQYHETGTSNMPQRRFLPEGRQAGDFAARRSAEYVLRLTPGSLGSRQR